MYRAMRARAVMTGLAVVVIMMSAAGCSQKIKNKTSGKAVVFGVVKEDTVSPKAVAKAKVQVGGRVVTTDSTGHYRVTKVAVGRVKLVVKAEDRETYQKYVGIEPGDNKANISISVTPDETMKRWLSAQKEKDYALAYQYLHPRNKKIISQKEYIEARKQMDDQWQLQMKKFKIGKPKIAQSWVDADTGRLYKKVAEMETYVTFDAVFSGKPGTYTSYSKTHLVKVGHRWTGFWSRPGQ